MSYRPRAAALTPVLPCRVGFEQRQSYPVSLTSPPLTDIPEGATAPCPAGNPTRYQLSSRGADLRCFFRRVVPEQVPSDLESLSSPPLAERSRGSDRTFSPVDDPPVLQAQAAAPPPVLSLSRRIRTKAERPRPLTSPPLTENSRGSDPTLYQPRAAAPTPFLTLSRQLGTNAERPSVPCIAPSDRTVQRERLCVFLRTTRVTKFQQKRSS